MWGSQMWLGWLSHKLWGSSCLGSHGTSCVYTQHTQLLCGCWRFRLSAMPSAFPAEPSAASQLIPTGERWAQAEDGLQHLPHSTIQNWPVGDSEAPLQYQ